MSFSTADRMAFMRRHPVIVALMFIAVIGCGTFLLAVPWGSQHRPEDQVVARVGDRTITVKDFRLNYEFGYPHLKQGRLPVERKRAYLRAMVNELLIANEGFTLGLDRNKRVRDLDMRTTTDLLAEELLRVEVVEKTHVSDAEVKEALNRSKVAFKLRYWGEPSPARAFAVRQAMIRDGFMPVVDGLRRVNTDFPVTASMLESGYLNAFELDPVVLNAVKDLGLGDMSLPVHLSGGYYVFQLTDLRRHGILEQEYSSRFESMKKVLLNARYDEGIVKYVGSFMTARGVVTRGAPFWKLCEAVVEWKSSGDHRSMMLRDAVASSTPDRRAYAGLNGVWDEALVTYDGGQYTVGRFLDIFMPALRDLDPADMPRVRHLLSEQVALTVRNDLLAGEARRLGLDRNPAVEHERQQWLTKTVYEEVRHALAGDGGDHSAILAARQILERKADSLRTISHVTVYDAVLDTVKIDETTSSRMTGMQLFKLGTKTLAVPMTDGIWGSLN